MPETEHRPSAWWVVLISAALWWVVGFLPWIAQASYQVMGFREGSVLGGGGDWSPLPFTDGGVVALVVMALIGGLAAGLVARWPAVPRAGALAATAGVVLAITVTTTLSWFLAVRPTTPDDAGALGMVVVTSVAGVVGLGIGLLAALGPAALRGLVLALPLVLVDAWLRGLVPGGSVTPSGSWWVFVVALGLVFGLTVDRRPIELLGWLPAAGAVWVLQGAGGALLAVQENLWPGSPLTEAPLSAVRIAWTEMAPSVLAVEEHQLGAWVIALLLGAAIAALRLSREASEEGELAEVAA